MAADKLTSWPKLAYYCITIMLALLYVLYIIIIIKVINIWKGEEDNIMITLVRFAVALMCYSEYIWHMEIVSKFKVVFALSETKSAEN
jgi:hypothetical protein